MKVQITFEADDELRRAVNHYYGKPGLATHKTLVEWFRKYGESVNEDAVSEMNDSERGECEL